jgi:Polyketide cyclase / dehydrase and lipid transport.
MLKIVLAVVVLALAAVLVIAAFKPDTFQVQRRALIKAPPEKIYPLLSDFQRWGAWSPWEKKDPGMKRSFAGPKEGKGASYAWDGDKNVGQGRMEIVEATPPSRVALKLDFLKPFEAHNTVQFELAPKGELTEVLWGMQGPVPYVGKIMHVFVDMDRMVGADFEAGLANLKTAAEK